MSKRIILFIVTTGTLLGFNGPVSGQEVNSDVNIPPPRALVSGASAISGLMGGTESVFQSSDEIFLTPLAQAATGAMNEVETRGALGHFMTSLLVRAGIIAFDSPPAELAASVEDSKDESRPAWTGPTPMVLSAGMTGRAASIRRR